MRTTRLDLITDGSIVLIVRKGSKPFRIISKNNRDRLVSGIWLLTGEQIYLDGGEATLPTDNNWMDSLIIELENQKLKIDETIKMIKSLVN
jgi:hypothetical protein